MLDNIIKVYKKCGETPLECINKLKFDDSDLRFLPMTYAGRLDPIAEGVLLILVGDECHKKDEYLALSKEYEVEVLFGFATDTYDVLGKIEKTMGNMEKLNNRIVFKNILSTFVGRINQSYPPYSSRTVKGKPLWQWAREDKLGEITIPSHDVLVENIDILESRDVRGFELLLNIKEKIGKVKGDFRQEEIIPLWESNLKDKGEEKYQIIKLRISCGSGVYVRGIAYELGKKLNIPSLALSIKRIKVGEYDI